ncbi:MAG TPA: TetR/AcrR family transcriptional regulator [Bauldia sp.]|nr:TetR/AcrR family transcriptional regulator [Bauldia sp.]
MAKRGRPATFDRDEALRGAMEVFWARGYEGATLEDLQAAMGGISPPSLYNAFGSKEALFKEVVDLFMATVGAPAAQALAGEQTAREAIEGMLRRSAEAFSMPGKPHGCLVALGATNCAPANKGPQDYLLAIRRRTPGLIKQRLDRAVAEGELPAGLDTGAVAAFYTTIAHGLGIRAGDGASRRELMAAVDGAMAAWSGLTSPDGKGARRPPKRRAGR